LRRPQPSHHRANAGMIILSGAEVDESVAAIIPAQHEVRGGAMRVTDLVVSGADDGRMVSLTGHAGKVLAHQNAGHRRCDRLEVAAEFYGRVGLHVPHIRLGWTAAEPDQNARTRTAGSAAWLQPLR